VFGEMAILDPAPRIASAEALEPADLLRLSQRDMDQIIDERPEVGRGLIRTLTRTLRSRLDDLATIRAQIDSANVVA
jgi:CRP-like cAMP-binding protein